MGAGNQNWRFIYLDGRPQTGDPLTNADNPLYFGHARGKWEGDTLVVDTKGFNDSFWFSNGGLPHTDLLHLVERFTRSDYNTLKYEVTVEGVTTRGRVESDVTREYYAMDVSDDSRVVRLVKEAASRMGLDVKTLASGGGCDANIFNKRGIECANLGTGMRAIHTVKEWLDVKDMYASAEMTLEIMRLNGETTTNKG